MKDDQIRVFDLFCGAGGSSRGAAMAGAIPVAALDMWDVAAKTYKLNFPEAKVYEMKANLLSPHRILDEVGKINLLLASPECTNHSIAKGGKPRCEKSKDTAFEVVRFAKVLKPRWLVVENVLQMRRWHRFDEWISELSKIGYNLKLEILDAQYFNTPQSRRRLFIIGDLETIPSFPKPKKQTMKTVSSIIGLGENKKEPWPFSPLNTPKRAEATIKRGERAIKELGEDESFIMVYYSTDAAGGFQSLHRPLRTITTIDRFAYVRPNGAGYEMRMLQPPELAAAMGFYSSHLWADSTRRNRIKLTGNAVCPPVMKEVVKAIIK